MFFIFIIFSFIIYWLKFALLYSLICWSLQMNLRNAWFIYKHSLTKTSYFDQPWSMIMPLFNFKYRFKLARNKYITTTNIQVKLHICLRNRHARSQTNPHNFDLQLSIIMTFIVILCVSGLIVKVRGQLQSHADIQIWLGGSTLG